MNGTQRFAPCIFASGMIALGILGLTTGDFASIWQPIAAGVPARHLLAYLCAALELGCGIGLLWRRAGPLATQILFVYLVLWILLLKVPGIVAHPASEGTWSAFGEIAMIVSGGWVLFSRDSPAWARARAAWSTGESGRRIARCLLGCAAVFLGLSHFVYHTATVSLVPGWLPFRAAWASITGAAQIAAGVALLANFVPRVAATLEAAMITIFTVLVWIPPLLSYPRNRVHWTDLIMSWVIGSGVWVVALNLPGREDSRPSIS